MVQEESRPASGFEPFVSDGEDSPADFWTLIPYPSHKSCSHLITTRVRFVNGKVVFAVIEESPNFHKRLST